MHIPDSRIRPADILVHPPDHPSPTAVDVSVVHPLQLSSPSAEEAPGAFAAAREQEKALHHASCAAAGWSFTPVAVEVTGAWGPSAQKFVRMLISRQSMRTGAACGTTAAAVWGRLGAVVAKGVATMLTRTYGCGVFPHSQAQ